MTEMRKNYESKGVFRFLFLGATELEYHENNTLNIHQESTFVTSFTETKKHLKKNTYDVLVINAKYLLEKEIVKFLKTDINRTFVIVLNDASNTSKYSFVDCYLPLDNCVSSNILTSTISLFLKKTNCNTYSFIKAACAYEMLGGSTSIRKLRSMILGLQDIKSSIMIAGESGTGKEFVARMLNRSVAKSRPFVAINCSSIPDALFESELFGHKKGAFTGALYDKKGLVEQANGGDLFLDEIADLPMALQAKFLRVLQDGWFFKIGSSVPIKSTFRLISATNKSLERLIGVRKFRKDLYYRINVVRIKTTPLRDKPDDIPCLFKFFTLLQLNELGLGKCKVELSTSALRKLSQYSWEGNIRELKNVVDRTLVKCKFLKTTMLNADDVELEDVGFLDDERSVSISDISPDGYKKFLLQAKRLYYNRALKAMDGNVGALADKMGLGRSTVFRHVKELDVRNPS